MLRRPLRTAAALLAAAALPAVLRAQAVSSIVGTPYVVAGPVQSTATGASMSGMLITASFADGTVVAGTWGALGTLVGGIPDYGVVFTGRLRLSHVDTDTYPSIPWYLRRFGSSRLTSLAFDGAPGNTGFDRAIGFLGLGVGTPGSSIGGDFTDLNPFWNGSSAVYSDVVAVAPQAPVGDLYRRVTVTFAQDLPRNVVTGAREVYFSMDTDQIGAAASVVPEPGTWALVGTGLVGLAAASRRRRAQG